MKAANLQARALPWDELQDFHALAVAGQLARAGKLLGVNATTIGRRLRKLEARLGQTLFEQTREGHVLTEAGEALLAHVEVMQRAASEIQDIPSAAGELSGTMRISVSEGFGTWFIARHLAEFHRLHPKLTIDLAATSGFLNPSRRETDLAVLLARPRTGPVISGKLSDYRLRLYGARDYLESRPAVVRPDDLSAHSLIGYVPDLLYSPELDYLKEIGPQLRASVRSSSINAQHRLIACATGIGVLPCFMGDADPDLVPVLPELTITRSFWLVTHRDTRQIRRVRAFRDWLVELTVRHRGRLLGETPPKAG